MSPTLKRLLARFAAEAGTSLKQRNTVRLPMTPAEVQAFSRAKPEQVRSYLVVVCEECGGHALTRPATRRKWEQYCSSACRDRAWRRERQGAVSQPA